MNDYEGWLEFWRDTLPSGKVPATRYKLPAKIREADRIAGRKKLGINGKKGDRLALLGALRLQIERMRLNGRYDAMTLGALQAWADEFAIENVDRRVKLTPAMGAEIERFLVRGLKAHRVSRAVGCGVTAVQKYIVANGWCIDGLEVRRRRLGERVNCRGKLLELSVEEQLQAEREDRAKGRAEHYEGNFNPILGAVIW